MGTQEQRNGVEQVRNRLWLQKSEPPGLLRLVDLVEVNVYAAVRLLSVYADKLVVKP